MGGLARKATLIAGLPADEPRLVLDAGDAFARGVSPDLPQASLLARANLMVDAFNTMGMNAYTVGERDLVLGVANLKKLAERANYEFLAANLLDSAGKPVFTPSVVKRLGDIRVGIMGLLGKRLAMPNSQLEAAGLKIDDPVAAARAQADRLADVDLLVALSHLGHGEERQVSAAVPEIRFFIGSHAGRHTAAPQRLNGTTVPGAWAVDAGSRGKHLGRLEIFPVDGALQLASLVDAGAARARAESLERRDKSLTRMRQHLQKIEAEPDPPPERKARRDQRIASMRRSIERLEQQIASERSQVIPAPPTDKPLFKNEVVPVEVSIAEHPAIAEAVKKLQATTVLQAPTKPPVPAVGPRNQGKGRSTPKGSAPKTTPPAK